MFNDLHHGLRSPRVSLFTDGDEESKPTRLRCGRCGREGQRACKTTECRLWHHFQIFSDRDVDLMGVLPSNVCTLLPSNSPASSQPASQPASQLARYVSWRWSTHGRVAIQCVCVCVCAHSCQAHVSMASARDQRQQKQQQQAQQEATRAPRWQPKNGSVRSQSWASDAWLQTLRPKPFVRSLFWRAGPKPNQSASTKTAILANLFWIFGFVSFKFLAFQGRPNLKKTPPAYY